MGTDCKSALPDVGLIFTSYNLRQIFNMIDQNLWRQYLKVLSLCFGVLTPVFNDFYGLFYFMNEECFFPKRILICGLNNIFIHYLTK